MGFRFLVVGAGFSGAVVARQLADSLPCKVQVIESRSHIGGNCHTSRDETTGVMVHRYGPHIFNTSDEEVWRYVNRFGHFNGYINRVKANTGDRIYSLPLNLLTLNQFFGKTFTPHEAQSFLREIGESSIEVPQNFEEQALKFVGTKLYEAFFKGYTLKQWGTDPRNLPADILKRLPIRFNYDDNYYNTTFQGMPADGYTAVIENILNHPEISVDLNTIFRPSDAANYDHTFYTGPIDAFFDHKYGRLRYRTVEFEQEIGEGDVQGCAVMNYTSEKVPYTRVHEHKHFAPWENHKKSILFREYSKPTEAGDTPYYPLRLAQDIELLGQYQQEVGAQLDVTFLGRLATYRYLDMDDVIAEALAGSAAFIDRFSRGR
jgi:UDP-galactopyranose mutase